MPPRQPDAEVMRVLRDTKVLVAEGQITLAIDLFEETWADLVSRGQHFSASHVAHMAGAVDPVPERTLQWNERAIAAADAEPDRSGIEWFYPSLYNNLAYSLVLLGRRDEALRAERTAWSRIQTLEPGPYADQVRSVIQRRLAELIGEAKD